MEKKSCQGKKIRPLEFILQKEVNLDNESNFTVNIFEKNNVEKEKFIDGDEYLLLNLELKLKADDITKFKDYNRIKALSGLIKKTKKPSQTLIYQSS